MAYLKTGFEVAGLGGAPQTQEGCFSSTSLQTCVYFLLKQAFCCSTAGRQQYTVSWRVKVPFQRSFQTPRVINFCFCCKQASKQHFAFWATTRRDVVPYVVVTSLRKANFEASCSKLLAAAKEGPRPTAECVAESARTAEAGHAEVDILYNLLFT